MSSFSPSFALGNFVPSNINLKGLSLEDGFLLLQSTLENYAKLLNRKDTGQYDLVEVPCNQEYFGADPQTKRQVLRKVFDIGAIAAGATSTTAHNISGIVEMTRLYGTCTTNVVDYRPIPFISLTALNQGIELRATSTDVIIVNGGAAPPITAAIIVLEFVKE